MLSVDFELTRQNLVWSNCCILLNQPVVSIGWFSWCACYDSTAIAVSWKFFFQNHSIYTIHFSSFQVFNFHFFAYEDIIKPILRWSEDDIKMITRWSEDNLKMFWKWFKHKNRQIVSNFLLAVNRGRTFTNSASLIANPDEYCRLEFDWAMWRGRLILKRRGKFEN